MFEVCMFNFGRIDEGMTGSDEGEEEGEKDSDADRSA
jgi:hypothetical protein